MAFQDDVSALLRAMVLPADFRWSFRNDGITTLHYGHRNVVLELDPKPAQGLVQLRSRPMVQRAHRDDYPELSDAGRMTLQELEAFLDRALAPFSAAQQALV